MSQLRQRRILVLVLSAALAMSQIALPLVAHADALVDKTETVHVRTDASGTPTEVRVEALLANDGSARTLRDSTTLADIEPQDDDQTYTRDASGALVWRTQGRSVTYEGTTDATPPVALHLSYALDGEPVRAEELAGATGHLVIRIDYENTAYELREVAGVQHRVYVPFVCVTATLLDADLFDNVQVENGQVVGDKGGLAVVGYAVPGLAESLGLGDGLLADLDLDLPTYVQIEADVHDLELDPLYTVATAELLASDSEDALSFGDLDEMDEASGELKSATDQLVEGTDAVTSALGSLSEGASQLGGGALRLREALGALPDGLTQLQEGADTLAGRLGEATDVADQLATGAAELSGAAQQANDLLASSAASLSQATEDVQRLRDEVAALDLSGLSQAAGNASGHASFARDQASALASAYQEATASMPQQREAVASGIAAAQAQLEGMLDAEGLELSEEQRAQLETQIAIVQEQLAQAAEDVSLIDVDLPDEAAAAQSELESSIEALAQDTDTLGKSAKDLSPIDGAANTALSSLAAARGALAGAQQYVAGVADGATSLRTGISGLSQGLEAAQVGAGRLADALATTATQAPQALAGMDALATGIGQLASGIDATASGQEQLASGLRAFADQGISELARALDELGADMDDIQARLDTLRASAQAYDSFSGKADGATGSVRFVFQTERIG